MDVSPFLFSVYVTELQSDWAMISNSLQPFQSYCRQLRFINSISGNESIINNLYLYYKWWQHNYFKKHWRLSCSTLYKNDKNLTLRYKCNLNVSTKFIVNSNKLNNNYNHRNQTSLKCLETKRDCPLLYIKRFL